MFLAIFEGTVCKLGSKMQLFRFFAKNFFYCLICDSQIFICREVTLYISYDQIQDACDGLEEFRSYNGSICAVMKS